ncbi:MAG: hypothetical protein IJY92_05930 [Alphaproteobacteria bacterium]|nr:hypothetical protein [Alphaproteobacteria bacterium]
MTGTQTPTQPTAGNTDVPPQGQQPGAPQPFVLQGKPLNSDGKTAEEVERERQEAAAKKRQKESGSWWERNKDWLWPLIAALIGGALGYTVCKLLGDRNSSAVNTLVSNIDMSEKTDKPANTSNQQGGANPTLAGAGQQTPSNQNSAQPATPAVATPTQGR